jgi:hypothetical protein
MLFTARLAGSQAASVTNTTRSPVVITADRTGMETSYAKRDTKG